MAEAVYNFNSFSHHDPAKRRSRKRAGGGSGSEAAITK